MKKSSKTSSLVLRARATVITTGTFPCDINYPLPLQYFGGEVLKAAKKEQETSLEREYSDCIKSRRDKIGITRHIIMHQVLYIVQLHNEEGDMHII